MVSNHKRTIWDDIIELGRDVVETLDEALHPEKRRKPARVPVPVRTNQPIHDPHENPYR